MTLPDRSPAVAPIRPEVIAPELVPDRRGTVSLLSSVSRSGDWIVPRVYRAVSILASVELDLTSARIGPGTSLIEVVAVMGSVVVVAPPGLRIECDGDPIFGSIEVKADARSTTAPDAPLVRIRGSVVMGSVEVRIVDPDAPRPLSESLNIIELR